MNSYAATVNQNRFFLTVLSTIFLSLSMIYADDIKAGDEVSTSVQIVSLYPLEGDETVYLKAEGEAETQKQLQIKVSSSRLPEPINYKGGRKITLSTQRADDDYQAVASLELPETNKQTIIVLYPASMDSAVTYLAKIIDASWSDFKPGTRRIINFSKHAIRGEIGSQPFTRGAENNLTFQCEPQETADVPVIDSDAKVLASHPVILEYRVDQNPEKTDIGEDPKEGKNSGNAIEEVIDKATEKKPSAEDEDEKAQETSKNEAPKVVDPAEIKNEQWRVLSSTRWFYTPEQRHLVFVYDDEGRKATVVRGISQSEPTK